MDSGRVATVVTMTSLSLFIGHAPGKLAPDCPVRADPSVDCPCATAANAAAATKHRNKPTPDMGARSPASLQGMNAQSQCNFALSPVRCELPVRACDRIHLLS